MQSETVTDPVIVAKIVKPHALTGEVVLESYTDVEGRLEEPRAFLLMDRDRFIKKLRVESFRFFRGRYVVKFHEVSSREEAEALRDKELAIPEEELGSLPPDHFFIYQLIGMKVQLLDGREVGAVTNVLKTGGVDLLEVGKDGEILIPFAEKICVEVNLNERRIVIDPPEGLLQLNAR